MNISVFYYLSFISGIYFLNVGFSIFSFLLLGILFSYFPSFFALFVASFILNIVAFIISFSGKKQKDDEITTFIVASAFYYAFLLIILYFTFQNKLQGWFFLMDFQFLIHFFTWLALLISPKPIDIDSRNFSIWTKKVYKNNDK